MNPRSAIKKGKDLENHVCRRLNELGIDSRAARTPGSGNGVKKADIMTDIGWAIEAKNTKRFDWSGASAQVRRDAMGHRKEMIVWHPPNRPMDDSVAIVSLEDLLDLLKFYKDHQGRETILDKYTIKSNLERAVHHLKQVVKEI